jgi:RHS repeat-associated protein
LIDHYEADVRTAQDYYPFGMIMPGRMLATLSIPGGSFSGTTQVNGYTLPVDLSLNSRTGNQPTSYVATDLIDLNEGFESGTNDDVTAYIADGSYAGGGNGSNDNAVAGNGNYPYSFNGKRDDNEMQWQDYGMREYDRRRGQFISVDPLTKEYPYYSPYQFAGNKPIWAIDLDGMEEYMSTQLKKL